MLVHTVLARPLRPSRREMVKTLCFCLTAGAGQSPGFRGDGRNGGDGLDDDPSTSRRGERATTVASSRVGIQPGG